MCKVKNMSRISHRGFSGNATPCAVCHSKCHNGKMSARAMQEHRCLEKQCRGLEPVYMHPFWAEKWLRELRRTTFKVLSLRNPYACGYHLRKQIGKMSREEMERITGMSPPQKLKLILEENVSE